MKTQFCEDPGLKSRQIHTDTTESHNNILPAPTSPI